MTTVIQAPSVNLLITVTARMVTVRISRRSPRTGGTDASLAFAAPQPMARQPHEGQHKADEDVDAVEHHQLVDPAAGDDQGRDGREQPSAGRRSASLRRLERWAKLVGHPAIDGHIGQRRGPPRNPVLDATTAGLPRTQGDQHDRCLGDLL